MELSMVQTKNGFYNSQTQTHSQSYTDTSMSQTQTHTHWHSNCKEWLWLGTQDRDIELLVSFCWIQRMYAVNGCRDVVWFIFYRMLRHWSEKRKPSTDEGAWVRLVRVGSIHFPTTGRRSSTDGQKWQFPRNHEILFHEVGRHFPSVTARRLGMTHGWGSTIRMDVG